MKQTRYKPNKRETEKHNRNLFVQCIRMDYNVVVPLMINDEKKVDCIFHDDVQNSKAAKWLFAHPSI